MSRARTTADLAPAEARAGADRVLDVLASGGAAIVPLDTAYGIVAHRPDAVRRIFQAKRRSYAKPSGLFANWEMFQEIHRVGPLERDVVRTVTLEHDLPFSAVAPFRADHPMLKALDPFVLDTTTKAQTLDMLLNAGPLHAALTRRSHERGMAVVGSSANLSLAGTKYRLEDVEAPVRAAAELALDGGVSRYRNDEGYASTIVDLRDFRTVRRGVCYERICDILLREFRIDLCARGPA